jgi:hypothetical protein
VTRALGVFLVDEENAPDALLRFFEVQAEDDVPVETPEFERVDQVDQLCHSLPASTSVFVGHQRGTKGWPRARERERERKSVLEIHRSHDKETLLPAAVDLGARFRVG